MLEAMCLPIPSELIIGVSALLIVKGAFAFLPTFLTGWAGSVCGSAVLYIICKRGGRPLVYRYGRLIKLTPARFDKLSEWFERFGPILIIPWWQIPGLRAKVGAVTGLLDLNPRVFIVMTVLATGCWNYIGLKIALSFGQNWSKFMLFFSEFNDYIAYLIGAVVISAGLIWFWRRRDKRLKARHA